MAVTSIDVSTRRSQLGSPTGADRDERAFALRAVQQLTDLQRVASGPMVELGGHVAQLHALAAHRGEQLLDILGGPAVRARCC